MAKVAKKVDEGMQWLNTKMSDFQKTPLHKTPSVTPSQIYSEKKVIIAELCTVKPRKHEHIKIRTCSLISWKKTPKDKNQKQTDLLQCSNEMVHLIKKFHHISVNKLPTFDN